MTNLKETMENLTKEIELPLFGGFYNSIHEFNMDYIIEDVIEDLSEYKAPSEYNYPLIGKEYRDKQEFNYSECEELFHNSYDIDYDKYNKDYTKEYTNVFNKEYSEELKTIGFKNITYKGITSPREYNFATDTIDVDIEYNITELKNFIIENKENFSKYIKEQNTSYDGFIAYGSNDVEIWLAGEDFVAFELTQIMDFAIHNNFYSSWYVVDGNINLHYDASENVYAHDYIIKLK